MKKIKNQTGNKTFSILAILVILSSSIITWTVLDSKISPKRAKLPIIDESDTNGSSASGAEIGLTITKPNITEETAK